MPVVRILILICLLLNLPQCGRKAGSLPPIRLLMLTGSGNHEWPATTAFLEKMYGRSGLFAVETVLHPDSINSNMLSHFDVLVNNRNVWPDRDCDWSDEALLALFRFVEEGGGFVTIHSAGAYCYDRQDFQQLSLATWGENTRHGDISEHHVHIGMPDHPVTRGISDFLTFDELWIDAEINPDATVIGVATSEEETREPVILVHNRGKGRMFCNLLGHDVRAMRNSAWQTLTIRGTEWAARGEVSYAVPQGLERRTDSDNPVYSWHESDSSLALLMGDRVIWQFNFRGISGKPYFHPLALSDGTVLTAQHPSDHPWHLGLWHSWKYIDGINYWEYKPELPWDYAGETELIRFSAITNPDYTADLHLAIGYRPEGGDVILNELRNIKLSRPEPKYGYRIDLDQQFEAADAGIVLDRTPLPAEPEGKPWGGYAGLSMRFSQDMFRPVFINSDGSTSKAHGQRFAWKYYGLLSMRGAHCGLAILDHPDNPRHPANWFMEDSAADPFFYFGPAPLFEAPMHLSPGESLRFRYRVLLLPGQMDYLRLRQHWLEYVEESR